MGRTDWDVDRVGTGIVGAAAGLLATIAYLAWRIEREAAEIEAAIDRTRESTAVLFDLPKTNAALERMTGELRRRRTEVES